jgi:hypothetical protein
MRIPQELQEADRLLTKYGRWAMDRFRFQHCASIEHKYIPPRDVEKRRDPKEVLIADFQAMDVQRALQLVPVQYRRVLQAEYIPQRLPSAAIKRMLKLTKTTWDGSHLTGLRMFYNNYRLHAVKKSA